MSTFMNSMNTTSSIQNSESILGQGSQSQNERNNHSSPNKNPSSLGNGGATAQPAQGARPAMNQVADIQTKGD